MIQEFRGKYFFLSNMSNSKIYINGLTFTCVESAFQSFKDINRQHEFQTLNGYDAKKLGRKVRLRSDWNVVRDNVMYNIVKLKFLQNPDLKRQLLATGNEPLIEGNTWGDTYWGMCNGTGQNKLGKILMAIRKELR